MNMCMKMRIDMYSNTPINMCVKTSINMCINTCINICINTRINLPICDKLGHVQQDQAGRCLTELVLRRHLHHQ